MVDHSIVIDHPAQDSGEMQFAGESIQGRNRRQMLPLRRRIQVVFQDPNRSSASPVVLLPEPDSPTSPSVSPARRVKVRWLTTRL
jgi:microcin C transport system ATP-binding protein